MKKLLLLATVSLFMSAGFAQKKVSINGKIKSAIAIDKIYLSFSQNGQRINDSTTVNNGTFVFNQKVKEPALAQVTFRYPAKDGNTRAPMERTQFYIEPGKVNITITDSLKDAEIKGGKTQKDYAKLNEMKKPFNDKLKELQSEYMSLRTAKDDAGMERIQKEFSETQDKMKTDVYLKFVNTYKNSPVALSVLSEYAGYDINPTEIEPLFNQLDKNVQNSEAGKSFSQRIDAARKTAVGAMAMNFTQNDTLGKPVSLTDFRGKYVLVDFWASWCGPCRAENPNVVKAHDKYKDKNFTVLGVSLDQPNAKQAWIDAIHKDELWWTQVSDLKFWDNEVAKLYGIRAIPQNLLIDPTGKIVAKNIRGEELQTKLAEILD